MAFSQFAETFSRPKRPGMTAAWGRLGAFRGVHHYDPNQPRVPKGHPNGGEWTRVAANELGGPPQKPRVKIDVPPVDTPNQQKLPTAPSNGPPEPKRGRTSLPVIKGRTPTIRGGGSWLTSAIELWWILAGHRQENSTPDLFGYEAGLKDGTVAVGRMDGNSLVGINSGYQSYTNEDLNRAYKLRSDLIKDYPNLMKIKNIGRNPNNALFHAETTLLLRAAAESTGGSLSGKTIEIVVDNRMCWPCWRVLPYIGLKLGNPTVTFTDLDGKTRTMRDGKWIY